MQEGAFKTFHESGSLMGSLIQIEPSEYVEIEGQLPCLLTVITVMEQHQSAERAERESRAERERERERERDRQTDRQRSPSVHPRCTLSTAGDSVSTNNPLPGKRPGAVLTDNSGLSQVVSSSTSRSWTPRRRPTRPCVRPCSTTCKWWPSPTSLMSTLAWTRLAPAQRAA